nr:ATP synthase F0 subunit 8 [Spurilla braziliana]
MPQLSPMMGFLFFVSVLSLYLVFLSSMSKSTKKVEGNLTQPLVSSKSFRSF